MKRYFIIFWVFILVLLFQGCKENNMKNTEVNMNNNESNNEKEVEEMFVNINGKKLKIDLVSNEASKELVNKLKKGDISYSAHDFGGFEKVGELPFSLPRSDTNINASLGDVLLYQGNSLCIYYDNNSYSFTRIGKIYGVSENELKEFLNIGKGDVTITLTLD